MRQYPAAPRQRRWAPAQIVLKDRERLGRDQDLGQVTLRIDEPQSAPRSFPVEGGGEVLISWSFLSDEMSRSFSFSHVSSTGAGGIPVRASGACKADGRCTLVLAGTKVTVTVHSASGFAAGNRDGTSDAYAAVLIGSERQKTGVIETTRAPVWDKEMAFTVADMKFAVVHVRARRPARGSSLCLRVCSLSGAKVEVKNRETLASNKLVDSIDIPLSSLDLPVSARDFPLPKGGTVKLSIREGGTLPKSASKGTYDI